MLKVLIYGLVGAGYGIILYFWWVANAPSLGADPAALILATGRLDGLTGAYLIMLDVITMARVPILEQTLGRQLQAKIHKWLGYGVFGLIILHVSLITTGYALAEQRGLVDQFLWLYQNYPDVNLAVLAVILLITIVVLSVWFVRRLVKYETWFFVHLLSYLMILLAFGHQLKNGNDFITQPMFTAYWYALYGLTFTLVVGFRFIRPLVISWRHDLRVDHLEQETPNMFSIYMKGRNLAHLHYQGGQFAIWRFLDQARWWQSHPFSLSAAPVRGQLRLTFKQVGDFTNQLNGLRPGTRVILDGPYGVFTAAIATHPQLLLIAGGSGLTPIISMLPEAAQKTRDIVVLYSVRTEADITLRQELENYAAQFGVKLIYVITEDPAYPGAKGVLTEDKIKELVPDVARREVFLCGPPPMMQAVAANLQHLGVTKRLIHTENFSF